MYLIFSRSLCLAPLAFPVREQLANLASSTNLNNGFQMRGVYLHRCAFIVLVLELYTWDKHNHPSPVALQEPHLPRSVFLLRNSNPKTRRRNWLLHPEVFYF